MAIQTVNYISCRKLNCGCCGSSVVLCIDPTIVAPKVCPELETDQPFEYGFINAEVCGEKQISNVCGAPQWMYTFKFDDEQLLAGNVLTSEKIAGVICDGCLISWVEDLVGNEPYIETDLEGAQTFVSPHGCRYPLSGGGGAAITVSDTPTVDLTLAANNLSADVNISADALNILEERADGLYAPELLVTDTTSVDLTLINPPNLLSATVIISPDANNCLTNPGNGLYVPCPDPESDDWHILGNAGTIDGTNFIGTTDNVAHDVRVNNIRARRTEPDTVCANIIDGGPDAVLGVNTIGVTIGGGGSDPNNLNEPHQISAGYFSTIGGGSGNMMLPDAVSPAPNIGGFSTMSGGTLNLMELLTIPWDVSSGLFQGTNTISGGYSNLLFNSDYNVIGGGFVNQIGYIGFDTPVDNYVWGDTIGGGIVNQILGGTGEEVTAPEELGANAIAGGIGNNILNGAASLITGGSNNFIDIAAGEPVAGPLSFDVIGGGVWNMLLSGTRATIGGCGGNLIEGEDSSIIAGGFLNRIIASTPVALVNDGLSSFSIPDPPNSVGVGNSILGGEANWIVDGRCSAIIGGAFLQIGAASFGYQSPATRTFTGINGGNRAFPDLGGEAAQVDVSAFSGIGYLGDVDLWIGNTDSDARKVKFFEPNADTDYSSTHYSSFEAQTQAANIEYVLPAAPGVVGQVLTIQSVVADVVTLEWA